MEELTPRQKKILKFIIEEYINSGEPVGSSTLEKKYELGVSPATIRNEMVRLIQKGYLIQTHTSAGRVPTARGIKFYVRNLMEEEALSVTDEVKVKEKIWDVRTQTEELLKQAVRVLAEQTGNIGFICTQDNCLFHSGYARILDNPEFFDINVTKKVLSMIEEVDQIKHFLSFAQDNNDVHLLFGEELGNEYLDPVGLVFTEFKLDDKSGTLGVIGSSRFNYPHDIPFIKYVKRLLESLVK